MPDNWANYLDTWKDIEKKYDIKHTDNNMTSGQEIATFIAQGKNANADIGDAGFSYCKIADKKGLLAKFKPTTWDSIPDWAKTKDDACILSYTGTIAFLVDKSLVKTIPTSWRELLNGTYKISAGHVGSAGQANAGLLSAAHAMGGNEENLKPGYAFFEKLAKNHRLTLETPTLANVAKGGIGVAIMWDFNALNMRQLLKDKSNFEVLIPSDGAVTNGYSTVLNINGKQLAAAKLSREYMLSDQGQINFAKGNARPIRSNVKLPESVKKKLLPESEYKNTFHIKSYSDWTKTVKSIPANWQQYVMPYLS